MGQVFKLYTKYSEALHATFLDPEGKEKPFLWAPYGIGVGRTLAAVIEQYHDANTEPSCPKTIAPYEVIVLPVNVKDEELCQGREIYQALNAQGIDAILDDRDERAGVKFKDADLIGYPRPRRGWPQTLQRGAMEVRFAIPVKCAICPWTGITCPL